MSKSFELQLAEIADRVLDDAKFIATEATQDLMEAAQTPQIGVSRGGDGFEEGKIPVDEGDLINSLVSSLNGARVGGEDQASYGVAIAGFELGDVLEFGWTQEYAPAIEYGWTTGSGKQVPGRHFVGANVARWQEFIDAAVAKVCK
ncbi:HK97 gp10 family phage protein [Leisingera methylohalidivorans]|uniref:HK97 gp10 family phage protein n=1 Tax=Leisingera methylohalidivorans DSM 14336 TaxID=999552 RepID=V9W1A1_9RHOB|nr:HK97 gp10 family phage protein [Leisingera methylohalidivorans]AHD02947.1 hypothetical protein METH_06865 [Leisingera methylohalidivorans DSM 14336]